MQQRDYESKFITQKISQKFSKLKKENFKGIQISKLRSYGNRNGCKWQLGNKTNRR